MTIGGAGGLDDAELRNRHLEVGKQFEQIGLERLVGAVDLVDQQHRRAARRRLQRLQQRAADQVAFSEDVTFERSAVAIAGGLGEADRHHLRRIVPLVDRGCDVEALVALQADQLAPEALREHLGDLRLADAGLALQQDRPSEPKAEEHDRR